MKRKARGKDSWGYPALTEKEVIAIVENAIPAKLRPYYVGIDVMKQEWSEPYSEWNTDIEVDFKYPVVGVVDDARYAHGDMNGVIADLRNVCEIDEGSRSEMLKDWDEAHDNADAIAVKKMRKVIRWRKPAKKEVA